MKEEKFEELVRLLWAKVVGAEIAGASDGRTYVVFAPTYATCRDALNAILPVIRANVIEECIAALNECAAKDQGTTLTAGIRALKGIK